MKLSIVFILGLSILISESAFACDDSKHPVLSSRKNDGTKVGLFIQEDKIKNTEEWVPDKGSPPFSITAAYKIIKEWAQEHYSRYDGVNVREISLKRYECSSVPNLWYYLIDLNPVIDGNELWGPGNWAAVLMDGTVIGAKEY
ncbi:MAG: hypothetical protein HWE39_00685 [Oceanospirillaceae bacterium]|nr:hypothetical protein [Oceanospirillaceae bacterium]